tara:strand:- start:318 stop:1037 length:720 start_codon:yes stop_codon:yes gene_type:complete
MLSCTEQIDEPNTTFEKIIVSLNTNKVSTSFVYIESTLDISREHCDEEGNCKNISESIHSALGSGMTISQKGRIYVLTAGHVCVPQAYDQYLGMVSYIGEVTNKLYGTGYYGNRSEFEVLAINQKKDICILRPKGRWMSPGVKLARKLPLSGSKVYMVSAPFGIFEPGLTLVYDGYLAGSDTDGDIMISMPTRPGTSGSAILDKKGRVIGVVHSAFSMMESVGIGTPVEAVHELFETIN